jgi:hypothetical protein
MRAEAALAELRSQLLALQADLERMENQFDAISAALARGEQLLVIERAEFRAGIQAAMNGDPVRWDLVGEFIGEPFEIQRTINFANVGEGAGDMLQALLNR